MDIASLSPLWLSLKVATISTVIVFLIGTLLARRMSHKQFFGKLVVESFLLLPLVLPPTVVGFGLLIFCENNSALGF